MSYQLKHLQYTIDYIIDKLRYDNPRKDLQTLSASDKKSWKAEFLLAIDPLQASNPKTIVINPSNLRLAALFEKLITSKIVFPAETTYLLKRNNISYECHDGEKKVIYNRQKIKAKNTASRLRDLQEQFRELHLDELSTSESSDEEASIYTPSFSTPLTIPIVEIPSRSCRIVARSKM